MSQGATPCPDLSPREPPPSVVISEFLLDFSAAESARRKWEEENKIPNERAPSSTKRRVDRETQTRGRGILSSLRCPWARARESREGTRAVSVTCPRRTCKQRIRRHRDALKDVGTPRREAPCAQAPLGTRWSRRWLADRKGSPDFPPATQQGHVGSRSSPNIPQHRLGTRTRTKRLLVLLGARHSC